MDEALQVVIEMTESIGQGFRKDLEDVTSEEVNWRPLPHANSINLILRHLCIEAQWHQASLERGEPMPSEATEELQRQIDSVPLVTLRRRAARTNRPDSKRSSAPLASGRQDVIRTKNEDIGSVGIGVICSAAVFIAASRLR